ncbi:OprO/OprP family phosphate-selective porin [Hydrogenimonas urashimensis]|uniref:OprO/OprP family phosphate-selective porin n=1 Tax=Hydrogenimonas urashimensis TaxID=2740515 RepID=UPI001915CF05|nr:porin [Hydrogenimonas urashimensis]
MDKKSLLLAVMFLCTTFGWGIEPLKIDEIQWYTPDLYKKPPKSGVAYGWNAIDTKWLYMKALAMIAFDYNHFHQDQKNIETVGELESYNRWDIRGARAGVAGSIHFSRPWSYLISGTLNHWSKTFDERNQGKYDILDCMVSIPLWGEYGRIQLGKMKEPVSMERVMGMVFEQTMERPMHLDALLPSRNIGIALLDTLYDGRLRWRIGIFNDWIERDDSSFFENNIVYAGRLTGLPYEDVGKKQLVHIGGSFRYEDVKRGSVRYDVGPENWFVDSWLDTGEIPADATQTANLEITYLNGPLWLASEYTATRVDSPKMDDPFFSGWHVTFNYFLTGEYRGYNYQRGTVRRIIPQENFFGGGWGALELSLRYSTLDLDSKEVHGGKMQITSAGFIWHPMRETQFHIQFSHAELDSFNPANSRSTGGNANIIQLRWLIIVD